MASAVHTARLPDDDTRLIDLHGELDIAVNAALRDILVDAITNRRPRRVAVTLRHDAIVDSTSLSALIGGYHVAQAAGDGRLRRAAVARRRGFDRLVPAGA